MLSVCFGASVQAVDDLSLNVAAGSTNVQPGDTVTVTLDVANLSAAINGVQIRIQYDTTIMTLVDVAPTDLVAAGLITTGTGWTEVSQTDTSGAVDWSAVINGGSISVDHTVATLTFTVIDEGVTSVTFRPDADPFFTKLTRASDSTTILPNKIDSGTITSSCDDGLACTTDTVVGGLCQHTIVAAGTVCRASTGPCDPAEVCDGVSGACPTDALSPAGTVCRASAGACDPAEVCDGVSAGCPADSLEPAGTVCRASTGLCDPQEVCDGATPTCPADTLQPAGTVCRASTGPCDPAEVCDGVSGACPADALEPAGTVCRASAGPCDPAEVCDGVSAGCPADSLEPAGTVCRASTGLCDPQE
ncbi:MAG: hypothetical protein D6788_07990, partial [Planctomycetota bacterium]